MLIVINLSNTFDVPCQRCGWLDGQGGVELQDNTGCRRVFCHSCTIELVRKLLPAGQFAATAPVPVALAS